MRTYVNADHILAAVGYTPRNLNILELGWSIELCAGWYQDAIWLSTGRPVNAAKRRLERICSAARRLELQLSHKDARGLIAGGDHALWTVKRLIKNIDRQLTYPKWPLLTDQEWPTAREFRKRTPLGWLIYCLRIVYLEFGFPPPPDSEASLSRDPFIRFVQAVLAELRITNNGKPYSRATIIMEAKDRARRKPVPPEKPLRLTNGSFAPTSFSADWFRAHIRHEIKLQWHKLRESEAECLRELAAKDEVASAGLDEYRRPFTDGETQSDFRRHAASHVLPNRPFWEASHGQRTISI